MIEVWDDLNTLYYKIKYNEISDFIDFFSFYF